MTGRGGPARFLVLGSASPDLLRQGSESLAGRIAYHELAGFSLEETGIEHHPRLWLRGGFPRSYLAASDAASFQWRQGFVRTFLERDLPQLGFTINAAALRRFWTMLGHYHGQVWNASEFGRSFGVADTTVRGYLDRLTSALVVRQLLPWFENIGKRQVKAPKVYVADSGLLHCLLDIRTAPRSRRAPQAGSVLGRVRHRPDHAAPPGGPRGVLFLGHTRRRRTGPPCHSRAEALGVRSQADYRAVDHAVDAQALADLRLAQLHVIHAGDHTFPLDRQIRAVALSRLTQDL